MKLPPRLRKGQLVRLTPGGSCYEVSRVGAGWAEVRIVYQKPKLVEIEGKEPFWATKGALEPPISAHSFVYPCPKEEEQ